MSTELHNMRATSLSFRPSSRWTASLLSTCALLGAAFASQGCGRSESDLPCDYTG